MAINTTVLVAAYSQYRADVSQALSFVNKDMTHSGITRQRHARVMKARAALLAKLPGRPTEGSLANRRGPVLTGLAPKNADQVAVQGREWAKVEALIKSGKPIEKALMEATTVERLAAIADNAEIWAYTQETSDPGGVADELQAKVFDRLVEVGYEPATKALAAEREFGAQAAWNSFLTDTINGEVGVDSLTALFQSDPEGLAGVQAANVQFDAAGTDPEVQRLDRLVSPGADPAVV